MCDKEVNTKMISEVWSFGCRDFRTAIWCKLITLEKEIKGEGEVIYIQRI